MFSPRDRATLHIITDDIASEVEPNPNIFKSWLEDTLHEEEILEDVNIVLHNRGIFPNMGDIIFFPQLEERNKYIYGDGKIISYSDKYHPELWNNILRQFNFPTVFPPRYWSGILEDKSISYHFTGIVPMNDLYLTGSGHLAAMMKVGDVQYYFISKDKYTSPEVMTSFLNKLNSNTPVYLEYTDTSIDGIDPDLILLV